VVVLHPALFLLRETTTMGATKSNEQANKANRRKHRGNINPADWDGVDAELLRKVIATVAKRGGAIRFGYTRDGGSYAIGILGDGDPYTEYLRPTDDVSAYFEGLIADWEDMS
jgi:hypothetical protein